MNLKRGQKSIRVWQGVSTDSLKFHLGPSCPTPLRPADGPPIGQAALWIPHTERACKKGNILPAVASLTKICRISAFKLFHIIFLNFYRIGILLEIDKNYRK
jgi:hypothetical protein